MIGCSRHALRRAAFIMLAVSLVLAAHRPAGGEEGRHPLLSRPAPAFKIRSGDDETMTSDMIKGKVAVIFYRDERRKQEKQRHQGPLQRPLRWAGRRGAPLHRPRARLQLLPDSLAGYGGVEKQPAIPFQRGWASPSMATGTAIWRKDYRMKDHDSNVMIVDKKGIIRYAAAGRITDEQFREIEGLIDKLVNKEK